MRDVAEFARKEPYLLSAFASTNALGAETRALARRAAVRTHSKRALTDESPPDMPGNPVRRRALHNPSCPRSAVGRRQAHLAHRRDPLPGTADAAPETFLPLTCGGRRPGSSAAPARRPRRGLSLGEMAPIWSTMVEDHPDVARTYASSLTA